MNYESTLNVLPTLDGRMGPDLQHLILELLTLTMAVILTLLTARLWRHRRRSLTTDGEAQ